MSAEKKWPGAKNPLVRLSDEVDRLFEELIHRPWGGRDALWNPSIDLYEVHDGYVLIADLPGFRREDIDVHVEGNTLVLTGQRSGTIPAAAGKVHFQERYAGSFERRMTLPETVDREKVHADFEHGVLSVHLPRKSPSQDQES